MWDALTDSDTLARLWTLDATSAWRDRLRNVTITPIYYFTEFDSWTVD